MPINTDVSGYPKSYGEPVFVPNPTPAEGHVYHHSDKSGLGVNVKVEKNTKGYNWEVTVTSASSVAEALMVLNDAETSLQAMYGATPPTVEKTEK